MFFRPYLLWWIGVLGLSLLANLLLLVPPLHMLLIYDYVLSSRSRETLVALLVFALLLMFFLWCLDYSRQSLANRAGQRMSLDLQPHAFAYDAREQTRATAAKHTPAIDDVRQARKFLGSPQMFAFIDAPWVPLFLAVEFLIHPWLGWFATMITVITFLQALFVEFRTRGPAQEEHRYSGRERYFRASLARGSAVVETHGSARNMYRSWCIEHDQMQRHEDELSDRLSFWTTGSKSLRMSAQIMVLSLGAWLVLAEEIGPGMMIVASIIMTRALAPVEQSISGWRGFVSARRAMSRVREKLGDTLRAVETRATPASLISFTLEATEVSSSPPGLGATVISGISLSGTSEVLSADEEPMNAGRSHPPPTEC